MVKKRVLVAMSGGVDSSVAAALLLEQGYEVEGATMELWNDNGVQLAAIESAQSVAKILNIKHHVFNMKEPFRRLVIDQFLHEYAVGSTPNPCIFCNQHLKFGHFLQKAESLACDYIATGHYAKIDSSKDGYKLRKAANSKKDQSYFLYRISTELIPKILFPLGDFADKQQIRDLALKFSLPVASRTDSQDICFIPDSDTRKFLLEQNEKLFKPGNIVLAATGEILGQHDGISFYTIGQRKGLGIAYAEPLYVLAIDASTNSLIVSTQEHLFKDTIFLKNLTFLCQPPTVGQQIPVNAKIRYAHKEAPAVFTLVEENLGQVVFAKKQRAVTPGQSLVFYEDDWVLGGGIIIKEDLKK